ncbi:MAG TPA: radical SAM family heme chaperone HemW [Candidatus Acidoferrales bacterium]
MEIHSAFPRTLGIYLQVPFCRSKCAYCNFDSGVYSKTVQASYFTCLGKEITSARRWLNQAGVDTALFDLPVDTIYLGGGTPSLFEDELACLMARLGRNFRFMPEREVTLEADPETVTRERAGRWRTAGFNRISLGVQSFEDDELKAVGRRHRRHDIVSAVAGLRAAGFENISFDLIAGLPHQTRSSWNENLAWVERLGPAHVSVYALEVDEGSRLGREMLSGGRRYHAQEVPDEDQIADFYEAARTGLAGLGYEHYEISNFARPGCASQHNLKYWNREPYLGLGASAHSFNGTARWANTAEATDYVVSIQEGQPPLASVEVVTPERALEETMFLGLRKRSGIDLALVSGRYGEEIIQKIEPKIRALENAGLLCRRGSVVCLAPEALLVSNEVFREFVE